MRKSTIAIIISFITVLFVGCMFVQAKTPETESKVDLGRTRGYISIEIQKGDTLWSIAEEYMTEEYTSVYAYIDDVKKINGLKWDRINAGGYLVVPVYSD